MSKCSKCGRKGIFLKLINGLCGECHAVEFNKQELEALVTEKSKIQEQITALNGDLANTQAIYDSIVAKAEAQGIAQAQSRIQAAQQEADQKLASTNAELATIREALAKAKAEEEKALKNIASSVRKVDKYRPLLRAIESAVAAYEAGEPISNLDRLIAEAEDFVTPTIVLDLQCLSMKDLRKRYRQNEKAIEETLQKYEGRYTTKANATIYKLMVIALKAELQNVLYGINYGKLEDALASITSITQKYYAIAVSGSQSIAPTMKKFIGEIDYFFQEAVKIEYEYYVQKERAKEEQRAIREQMRQEAEERRALEAEKKKIEKEECKYQSQISQLQDQLASADADKVAQLESRLAELQAQLAAVQDKKDEIATLQNGKAGNVYVISNLGSFGENVFKIGMTRRMVPQDRIDELGDASVPFPFDVHSFIFSDDASALETKIHKMLNDRRVNKVNLRKEFFSITIDELEALVADLAPTAEFKRTMLAEQYRQSLSITNVVDAVVDNSEEDE